MIGFLAKYVPFWAIPVILLFLELAYVCRNKDNRNGVIVCLLGAGLAFLCLVFYFWAGGPEKTPELILESF